MNIAQIVSSVVDEYLFGGKRERRIFSFSSGDERFILPVTPWRYQVQFGQSNKIVDILDYGEMLIFGNAKLHRLKFDCFFPATNHGYPFLIGDKKEPRACVELLEKWKRDKTPVRVIITDSPVNEMFAIMDCDFSERDGTRDIYYSLDIVEYKDWNTPMSNNQKVVEAISGLKERVNTSWTGSTITDFIVRNAADWLEASKIATGTFSRVDVVQAVNGAKNLASSVRQIGSAFRW